MTKITAHRVNSITSFNEVLADDFDGIEFDVQMSADGELFLYHDCFPKKYEGKEIADVKEKFINTMTMDEIYNAGVIVTPFVNLLKIIKEAKSSGKISNDFILHVELKSPSDGIASKSVDLVNDFGLIDQSIFRSFFPDKVISVKKRIEEIGIKNSQDHICLLFRDSRIAQGQRDYKVDNFVNVTKFPTKQEIELRLGFLPKIISLSFTQVDYNLINKLHEQGFEVCCYTLNECKEKGFPIGREILTKLDYVVTDNSSNIIRNIISASLS